MTKKKFINFKDITCNDSTSWNQNSIVSFDIDWASDEVLNYVLDILELANAKATFFVTHKTPVLERIRSNTNFELGIHPNFNPIFETTDSLLSPKKVISDLLEIVPEAKVIRSHSLTHSGRWLSLYKEFGIERTSNYMMTNVENLRPFHHVNGLTEVPIFFADDGYIYIKDENQLELPSLKEIVKNKFEGIRVFNFHPIHIALNTDSFDTYNATRPIHRNWSELVKSKNKLFGCESILKQLIGL